MKSTYIIHVYKYNGSIPVLYNTNSLSQKDKIVKNELKRNPYAIKVNFTFIYVRD